MRSIKDDRGVVTIELALIVTLLVIPVAIGVAKFAKPVTAWITTTSQNLSRNNDLQEENNKLLQQLLQQQQQQSNSSDGGSDEANTTS